MTKIQCPLDLAHCNSTCFLTLELSYSSQHLKILDPHPPLSLYLPFMSYDPSLVQQSKGLEGRQNCKSRCIEAAPLKLSRAAKLWSLTFVSLLKTEATIAPSLSFSHPIQSMISPPRLLFSSFHSSSLSLSFSLSLSRSCLLHRAISTTLAPNRIVPHYHRLFSVMTTALRDEQRRTSNSTIESDVEDGQVKIHPREKPVKTQAELGEEEWQEAHRLACEVNINNKTAQHKHSTAQYINAESEHSPCRSFSLFTFV